MTTTTTTTSTLAARNGGDTKKRQKDHILIFPFMAKGHTIPLLHLSSALAQRRLRVTLLTTPATAPSLRRSLHHHHPANIHLVTLPFPSFPPLPPHCESTDALPSPDLYPAFLSATALLRPAFHQLLLSLSVSRDLPLCVISDFFLGWTLDVCRAFGVPRLVFHGMGAFSMLLCKSLWVHRPHDAAAEDEPFRVPGAPGTPLLTRADVPADMRYARGLRDPVVQFVEKTGESDISSWGVLVNSFAELEREYVTPFESFYRGGARAWLVGPMSLLSVKSGDGADDDTNSRECMRWLDSKPEGSVLYVSFGTQVPVADAQLDEVVQGLNEAECEYLWVVRSKTWAPPESTGNKRGKIVAWAPQGEVLGHRAVGGFMSHCGWNSCLESVVASVPVLAWPMIAEQHLNAKFLVDVLGAGLRMMRASASDLVKREEITVGVKELMMGEQGKKARERVKEFGKEARAAVEGGGSSYNTLNQLLEELRSNTDSRWGDSKEGEKVAMDALQLDLQDRIRIA